MLCDSRDRADKYQRALLTGKRQATIETLAMWFVHHSRHAQLAADVWFRELNAGPPARDWETNT